MRWIFLLLLLGCPTRAARALGATQPFALHKVAEGIYTHIGAIALMNAGNEGGIANLSFIIGDKGIAVIDTGGSVREGRRFLAAIRTLSHKPILYVINTHVHPDHVFGNGAFVAPGTIFVGSRKLPATLSAQGPYYLKSFAPAMGPAMLADVTIVPPTLLVDRKLRLDLGDRVLILKAWAGGHSGTDISVEDMRTKTLVAGDLLFVRHIPVVDDSLLGYLADTRELALSDAATIVPGHGPVPQDWHRAVAKQAAYLETIKAELQADLKQGKGLAQSVQHVGESQRAQWQLFDDYNARNATTGFAELEWK
ncbi:MAG: quinoprotein relay system zinc metallohydrolase 2 [Hyphomicrobiales bacterium]|nr:quinoprotein relay system zinc metallohydrolase 2 [Hyphomicrobiales bacterium]MDE2115505.1 quinoprotein relay system zinc metallohydrolase 2 [Hyphomicrobiales bacterium]